MGKLNDDGQKASTLYFPLNYMPFPDAAEKGKCEQFTKRLAFPTIAAMETKLSYLPIQC